MLNFKLSSIRDEFYLNHPIFSKGEAITIYLKMLKMSPNLHVSKKGTCECPFFKNLTITLEVFAKKEPILA